jgi:hypothetical protein
MDQYVSVNDVFSTMTRKCMINDGILVPKCIGEFAVANLEDFFPSRI